MIAARAVCDNPRDKHKREHIGPDWGKKATNRKPSFSAYPHTSRATCTTSFSFAI